jgi:energy-coupling factor transporter ATP-binding protein EcfA2
MSGTIQKLNDQCQRLELRGQQVLTAVETGNLQTASVLKALSAGREASERDSVLTATEGPVVDREVMRLLISANRTSDERKAAEDCKKLLELFHDSSVNETTPDKEKGNYSAVISAIAPACWKFVAPHAAGIEHDLQQLESLARQISILETLRFDDMLRREDDITEAFGATYTWAFDVEASHLSSWLQTGTGIFWVSGKPGSGKSTFMKAIASIRLEQTSAMLRLWSVEKHLVVLKHFFWSTGTALQSSYKGLLEGLVYQAFQQALGLIPEACPVRWARTSAAADPRDLTLWSESELKETLIRIIDENESTHAFCFFIDGLDEFAENHYALVKDTIEYFATRSNAKFCVSSRPYNVFNNFLGAADQNKLQLELMNQEDIDQFVKGRLEQNQLFRDLAQHDARA